MTSDLGSITDRLNAATPGPETSDWPDGDYSSPHRYAMGSGGRLYLDGLKEMSAEQIEEYGPWTRMFTPEDIAYLLGRVKDAEDGLRDAKGTTVVSKAADMASRTPYSFKECFDMLVQATDLWGKLETLEAQREAVLAIHHPMLDEYGEPTKACEECLDAVPCPTVVALGGETE